MPLLGLLRERKSSSPGAALWLFRTFGEDDRKITMKAQTPEPPELYVCDLIRQSEISNRLAGLRANEQYHRMCGRANVMLPPSVQSIIHAEGVRCRGCGSIRTMSGSNSGE